MITPRPDPLPQSVPAPNTGWIGMLEPGEGLLMRRHGEVAQRTATILGVPLAEIVVEEIREPGGTRLMGWWFPADAR